MEVVTEDDVAESTTKTDRDRLPWLPMTLKAMHPPTLTDNLDVCCQARRMYED